MRWLTTHDMSVVDQISSFLSSKPSLEWVGPDLFLIAATETTETVPQILAPTQIQPSFGLDLLDSLSSLTDVLPLLVPAGIVLSSLGFVLMKKLQVTNSRDGNHQASAQEKDFDTYLRRYFKNQSERTMTVLERLVQRAPNQEPELFIFFASEESAVTALHLAMKLMKLIFLAKGEDKKLDEIEQEHVVPGKWYGQFTISWYFLNELRSALTQKTGIIINNFQQVHPNSSALLTFKTNELLNNACGTYLFLIVNTEDALHDLLPNVSPEEAAMDWWLSKKLAPHVRPDVIAGIQREIGENLCVIRKESLSTLMVQ